MTIQKLYPGGKAKAFSLSYDDGVLQDVRFVSLLNKYGLKGTFNLNSGLMRSQFTWTHECGMEITRLSESKAQELYASHEVASHTLTHPYMESLSLGEIMFQLTTDRQNLSQLFGREVHGFAIPFLYYSEEIAACVRQAGFAYGRISEITNDYSVPEDPYHWRGSKFHWDGDLDDFVNGFLETRQELAMCQIVGHSYDLDVYDMWEKMERIFRKIADSSDIAPMTNLELVRYTAAMTAANICDGSIQNHSCMDLWFRIGDKITVIHPGEAYIIQKK